MCVAEGARLELLCQICQMWSGEFRVPRPPRIPHDMIEPGLVLILLPLANVQEVEGEVCM